MKTTGLHILSYIGAALGILAGLDPALLGTHGAAIVGAAVAVGTLVHQVSTNPTTPAATVAKAHWLVTVIALALVLTVLAGCASVQSFLSGPTGAVIVPAGVDVAIATAEQKGVTAAQINRISKAVLAADTSSATTVVGLTSAVNAQLAKLNLPAGDVAAFTILETAFDAYLVAKYGSNPTVAQVQADVALFLNTAIAATGG